MTDPLDALTKRDDGDVIPESVPYLRLGSGLPSWGWDHEDSGLPEPEGGSLVQGLMWGGLIALGLWCVILSVLYWAWKAGWWWR